MTFTHSVRTLKCCSPPWIIISKLFIPHILCHFSSIYLEGNIKKLGVWYMRKVAQQIKGSFSSVRWSNVILEWFINKHQRCYKMFIHAYVPACAKKESYVSSLPDKLVGIYTYVYNLQKYGVCFYKLGFFSSIIFALIIRGNCLIFFNCFLWINAGAIAKVWVMKNVFEWVLRKGVDAILIPSRNIHLNSILFKINGTLKYNISLLNYFH